MLLALVVLMPASLCAQSSEAVIDSFRVRSGYLGEPRAVNVYLPARYAADAPRRFAVVHMPDGGTDEDFPHVVATVDSLIALGEIPPVLVVGIPNTMRRRDLTGPTRFASDSAIAPAVGGSAAFRLFLSDELVPEVARRYRTSDQRVLIGESLAGLFIVETLVLAPRGFTGYAALDPSLWWDGGTLLDRAIARRAALAVAAPRVFLAASDVQEIATPTGRLATVLAAIPGVAVAFHSRADLSHATIYRALKAEALKFVLR
jgi:predicted alpha/beta superfamily hydrolase